MSIRPVSYGTIRKRDAKYIISRQTEPSRFHFDPYKADDTSDDEASSSASTFGGAKAVEESDNNGSIVVVMASPTSSFGPSGTVRVVASMQPVGELGRPPFLPPPPPPPHRKSNLSEGTEHLLIAAGSIGATIFIVLAIYAIYSMRKRNLTFSDLLRAKTWKDGSLGSDPERWKQKGYQYEIEGTYTKALPVSPPETVLRRPTNASDRPFVDPQATGIIQSTYRDSERSGARNEMREEIRDNLYPLPTQLPSARTAEHTHTRTSSDGSDTYVIQSEEESAPDFGRSPQTFKQFLANRRISTAPPKASRFSWNTSQAAQTPKDPNFNRMSGSTNRSSVPRFRTVESWVNSQSNRVEAQRLKEDFDAEEEERGRPQMPEVPEQYRSTPLHQREPSRQTTKSEATVFRQHPGTEIKMPRGSLVPSEILDGKTWPPSL